MKKLMFLLLLAGSVHAQVLIPKGYHFYKMPDDMGSAQTRITNGRVKVSEFITDRSELDDMDSIRHFGLENAFGALPYKDTKNYYNQISPIFNNDHYFYTLYVKGPELVISITSPRNDKEYQDAINWMKREIDKHPNDMSFVWKL